MEEIKNMLLEVLMSVFKDCDIEVNRDLLEYIDFIEDLELDSITFVTLIIEIESKFDIIIPDTIMFIEKFRKFEDIANFIFELKSEKA